MLVNNLISADQIEEIQKLFEKFENKKPSEKKISIIAKNMNKFMSVFLDSPEVAVKIKSQLEDMVGLLEIKDTSSLRKTGVERCIPGLAEGIEVTYEEIQGADDLEPLYHTIGQNRTENVGISALSVGYYLTDNDIESARKKGVYDLTDADEAHIYSAVCFEPRGSGSSASSAEYAYVELSGSAYYDPQDALKPSTVVMSSKIIEDTAVVPAADGAAVTAAPVVPADAADAAGDGDE